MYYNNPYQSRTEVVRVTGKAGAEMYQLPPNSSILMMDETQPVVWLKVTDGAGYATLSPYKVEPFVEQTPPDMAMLLSRIEKLEGMLNESNAKEADKSAEPAE